VQRDDDARTSQEKRHNTRLTKMALEQNPNMLLAQPQCTRLYNDRYGTFIENAEGLRLCDITRFHRGPGDLLKIAGTLHGCVLDSTTWLQWAQMEAEIVE
jgi:hypothetical protein